VDNVLTAARTKVMKNAMTNAVIIMQTMDYVDNVLTAARTNAVTNAVKIM
jgi:FMN-dependent NADH-azoreductase